MTAFHFRLHPIGPILLVGMLMYPAAIARDLVCFWRDFMRDAPDEVNAALDFFTAPPEEFVPEPARGRPVVGATVSYNGSLEYGEEALRPLREFGPPAVALVQPMPYVALQQFPSRISARSSGWSFGSRMTSQSSMSSSRGRSPATVGANCASDTPKRSP